MVNSNFEIIKPWEQKLFFIGVCVIKQTGYVHAADKSPILVWYPHCSVVDCTIDPYKIHVHTTSASISLSGMDMSPDHPAWQRPSCTQKEQEKRDLIFFVFLLDILTFLSDQFSITACLSVK